MLLGITTFDELNALVGYRRSMPYEQYFGEMDLTPAQIRRRIRFAERLEPELIEIFEIMFLTYPRIDPTMVEDLRDKYLSVLEEVGLIASVAAIAGTREERYAQHADVFAAEAIDSTAQHAEDPYEYSEDRAMFIAENEANMIYGTDEFFDAIDEGCTHKTWITMQDNRVRDSHVEVDGETLPIEEPFFVGASLMMCPGDDSMGAGPEELVNCRCVCAYTTENEQT